MEISGKVPPIKIDAYINNVKQTNAVNGSSTRSSKSVLKDDKVDLSPSARDVINARAHLDSIPDVREEKVEEIKNQINNGTYGIDGKKIASNMIKESLIDEII